MLKYFAYCLNGTEKYLHNKGLYYLEVEDQWLRNLHFMLCVRAQLNQLNTKLQSCKKIVFSFLKLFLLK